MNRSGFPPPVRGSLVCIDCGKSHGPMVTRCPSCGGALDHTESLPRPTASDLAAPGRGVWRYQRLLPVPRTAITTLGEGDTPLVHDAVLGAHFKLESCNPTGSFKDRGATVVVSHAKAMGARAVVEDSSGNAGTAVAAYAARAHLSCTIFAPEHIAAAKRQQIETLGGKVEVVPGPRAGVTEAAVRHTERFGSFYANHAFLPHFLDGVSTLAYELVRDLGKAPDLLIAPCAMGSVILGVHRGFQGLQSAGIIERPPRLVAVQASGFAPLVAALGEAQPASPNRLADGLLVPHPPRLAQLTDAVKGSGGTALAVDETATREAMARLHKRGFLVEPSSAVAQAGLEEMHRRGEAGDDKTIVVVLTGRWKAG